LISRRRSWCVRPEAGSLHSGGVGMKEHLSRFCPSAVLPENALIRAHADRLLRWRLWLFRLRVWNRRHRRDRVLAVFPRKPRFCKPCPVVFVILSHEKPSFAGKEGYSTPDPRCSSMSRFSHQWPDRTCKRPRLGRSYREN
jgi:hypothetical protein